MVVRMRVFDKVGDPFAEGPSFLSFFGIVSLYEAECMQDGSTWFGLDRIDFPVRDRVPEAS